MAHLCVAHEVMKTSIAKKKFKKKIIIKIRYSDDNKQTILGGLPS